MQGTGVAASPTPLLVLSMHDDDDDYISSTNVSKDGPG